MASADDAEGDLAAVGDENARESHQSSAVSSQLVQLPQGFGAPSGPRLTKELTADC
jgi:hypothetical protein